MHLVKTLDTRGGFLGDTHDVRLDGGVPIRLGLEAFADRIKQCDFFFTARVIQHRQVFLGFGAQTDQQRGVAAIVKNHVGGAAIAPLKDAMGVSPVLHQVLALVGKDRCSACGNGSSSVVLGREDVARGPAHVCSKGPQGLNQDRGLDGHVQAAGDARAFQRLAGAVLLSKGHETGHFGLCDRDFLSAEIGQRDIGDHIVLIGLGLYHSAHGMFSMFTERRWSRIDAVNPSLAGKCPLQRSSATSYFRYFLFKSKSLSG